MDRDRDGKSGTIVYNSIKGPSTGTGTGTGAGASAAALLIEENERLKSIIKEMRADVEAMHRHSDSLTRCVDIPSPIPFHTHTLS